MVEKGYRPGAIVGLIGSIILLVVGLTGITLVRSIYYLSPDYPYFIVYINSGVTIALSAFALYGVIKQFKQEKAGREILLIVGIVGIIASFIPIYFYDQGYGYIQTFFLGGTFVYIDLVLILVGGILGYALTGKEEER